MIYINNVTKKYTDLDTEPSLENITLSVAPGEFVTVVGHSGAGKTTLTKLILAEEKPTSGTVSYQSVDIHKLPEKDLMKLRQRIGVVFQDFRLIPNKNAYEN